MGLFGKKKKAQSQGQGQGSVLSTGTTSTARRTGANENNSTDVVVAEDVEVNRRNAAAAKSVVAATSGSSNPTKGGSVKTAAASNVTESAQRGEAKPSSSPKKSAAATSPSGYDVDEYVTSRDSDVDDSAYEYRGGVMSGSGTYDSVDEGDTYGVTYSEDESTGSAQVMRKTSPNLPNPEPLVMANLMQWKSAAEDGPFILRLALVLSAVGMFVTSIVPFVLDPDLLTFRHGILAAYTFMLSIIIVIMDGRGASLGRNPVGARARLRKVFTKHFNVLRNLWGRGLLSIFAGTLHIAHMWMMTIISGGCVAGFGLLAFIFGCMSSYNMTNLKQSLTDDVFLEYLFRKHDRDEDGYLNAYEFSVFLVDVGVEFDDTYTIKAFNSIQSSRKRRVSFREFKRWWAQCKFDDSDERQDLHGLGV